jgi:hypothetical protein
MVITDKKQILLLAIYFAASFGSLINFTYRFVNQTRLLRAQHLLRDDLLAKTVLVQDGDFVQPESNDRFVNVHSPNHELKYETDGLNAITIHDESPTPSATRNSLHAPSLPSKSDPSLLLHQLILLFMTTNSRPAMEQRRLMSTVRSMSNANQKLILSNLRLYIDRINRERLLTLMFILIQLLSTCCACRAISKSLRTAALLSIGLTFMTYGGVLMHEGWTQTRHNPSLMLDLLIQVVCICILYSQIRRTPKSIASQSSQMSLPKDEVNDKCVELFNASFEPIKLKVRPIESIQVKASNKKV